MKRFVWLFVLILIAVPAFAAEIDEDDSPVAGDSSFGGANNFESAGPKVDPLIDIRNWLGRAGAPALEKKQRKNPEKALSEEVRAMSKSFEAQFGVSLQSALAVRPVPVGRHAGAAKPNPELSAEVRRISSQLSDKLIAALRMDQQLPLRKYQSELVRVRRLELMNQKIAASGIVLNTQQESEVEAAYARESYLRTMAIIEAAGASSEKTLNNLAGLTNQRVAKILDQSQRSVLSVGNTPGVSQQNP